MLVPLILLSFVIAASKRELTSLIY